MKVKPLWIVLAVGLIALGIAVDLSISSKRGGDNDDDNVRDEQGGGASTSRTELPGLRGRAQLEEARWQEASTTARMIGDALRIHYVRLGSFQGVSTGPAFGQSTLGLNASATNLTYFSPQDFRITELRSEDGYFEIEVRGSLGHSPAGTLRRNSRGEETRTGN